MKLGFEHQHLHFTDNEPIEIYLSPKQREKSTAACIRGCMCVGGRCVYVYLWIWLREQ